MFKPLAINNLSNLTSRGETPTRGSPRALAIPENRSTAVKPPIVDRDADFEIPKLWRDRDVYGKPQTIARALTAGERAVVERRHNELQIACSPFTSAEQDRAIGAISRMLGGFRSLRHDDDETAVAGLDGLRHVLAPFPIWAIEAGCLAISRGEAMLDGKRLDRRFPPNDSEIYGVVKEILKPYATSLEKAAALLSAPVQDERRRA